MRCKAIREDGGECTGMALEKEDFCVFHSRSKQAIELKKEGKKAGKGTTLNTIDRR